MDGNTQILSSEILAEFSTLLGKQTRGLIRELNVEHFENTIEVSGCVSTYYAVQLAIHAAKGFIATSPRFETVCLDFTVGQCPLPLTVGKRERDETRDDSAPSASLAIASA